MIKTYLYILGSGRSGSTLLDWVLDSHPQVTSLGEIGRLPAMLDPAYDDVRAPYPELCGCGKLNKDCPFWSGLLVNAREAELWQPGRDETWREALVKRLADVFPETEVLVDSSSWIAPYRRILKSKFLKREKVEVKTVYLSRDVRSVIYSTSIRGFANNYRLTVLRAVAGWTVRNILCLGLFFSRPKSMRLKTSYEKFTGNPQVEFERLLEFAGVSKQPIAGDWNKLAHHTFAGNRSLRESKGDIQRDDKWRTGLKLWHRFVIQLVAGPVNLWLRLLDGK